MSAIFHDIKNVNSLLDSILSLYISDTRTNYEYLYYYILCLINLKINNNDYVKTEFDESYNKLTTDTKITRDEEQWLLFIGSLPKPRNVKHFIGNEIEYSLNKDLKECEREKIQRVFVNKHPKHDIISRTWYKLEPTDKKLSKTINKIREVFKKSSMSLFCDKIKCKIRKNNIDESWEIKIKLHKIQINNDVWEIKIKQCIEIEAFFGDKYDHRMDNIYLGPISSSLNPPWSDMWIKNTEYLCIYIYI